MAKRDSTMVRRPRRTATEWRAEVGQWKASGLSAPEYAAQHGLHAGTLQCWGSKLGLSGGSDRRRRPVGKRGRGAARPEVFLPVVVTDEGPRSASRTQGCLQAEIVLISGRRVRLSGNVGFADLAQLVMVLEGGVPC